MNKPKIFFLSFLLSFIFIALFCPAFAEQESFNVTANISSNIENVLREHITNSVTVKENSPHGATANNSSQQGASGVVNAGAAAKPAASANIVTANVVAAQDAVDKSKNNGQVNQQNKQNKQNIKNSKNEKATSADYGGIKETPFADNEQIKVVLSNRDINRVFVTGDKIKTIHGPTGLYIAKNDPSDQFGSMYTSVYGDIPFTIFLTTFNGRNCSLLVIPKTIPGRTVILKPTTLVLSPNSIAETDSYQKTLVDLVNNMINLEQSSDYEYFSVSDAKKRKWLKDDRTKKTSFYNVADIIPIAFYRGEKLSGIVSKIRNKTRNPITLKPSYFYQSGIKAIALSEQIILPLEACWLYQIVGIEDEQK